MASKAWYSRPWLPGLLVESRTVADGIFEMSVRLAAPGVSCPDCAMPPAHIQRALGDVGRTAIWPQGEPVRRAGACCGGRLGGRPRSRMMARLSARWSRDAMLRVLQRGAPAAVSTPPARGVGIDDFAWRRGHSYGYGAVASEAAPQAQQVADRWHPFENASAAFLAAVRSEMPGLRRALAPTGPIDPAGQVVPIKAMARATGVSRKTIRKVLRGQRNDTFRTRQSSLNAWSLTLEAEWNAGCPGGAEL